MKKIFDEIQEDNTEVLRVRTPKGNETLGIIEQRLGASRMSTKCLDGFKRVCRIPGRLKRKLWVREGDIVLVEPWEFGGNEKGDILYKYKKNQVHWLKSHGYMKSLDESEEF